MLGRYMGSFCINHLVLKLIETDSDPGMRRTEAGHPVSNCGLMGSLCPVSLKDTK